MFCTISIQSDLTLAAQGKRYLQLIINNQIGNIRVII